MTQTTVPFRMPSLRLYRAIGRIPGLQRSFKAKVLTIAFLGTHVPLLTILAYFIVQNAATQAMAIQVLLVALLATLIGTGITLGLLYVLLRPISVTLRLLSDFESEHRVQPIRAELTDEMGDLINGTHGTLRQLQKHLDHIATHDAATGALNEQGLRRHYEAHVKPESRGTTLLLCRIHNLGELEVSLSSEQMTIVRRTLLDRLRLHLPADSAFAVRGRGQMAALLNEKAGDELYSNLDSLLADVTVPLQIGHTRYDLICVLGIASQTDAPDSLDPLLAAAESAVLQAREKNRSNWALASDSSEAHREQVALAFELDQAIRDGELYPAYQAKIDVNTGTVIGAEALIRWRHPERGLITPNQFIPMAERTGKIIELGQFVLEKALQQAMTWAEQGHPISVSVNLSAAQVTSPGIVDAVANTLARYPVPPERLELEITETGLMHQTAEARQILLQLRELGVRISLDDFGTGYSSLNYLASLPVDCVKIDRSFVVRMTNDQDREVLSAIINLAHKLRLRVIAEGVETAVQAEQLKSMGCDEWQGFYFAHPVLPDSFDWSARSVVFS